MLIDGGDKKAGKDVVKYLKKQAVKKLDLVVVTHHHDDHMDGILKVLKKFKVDLVAVNDDISANKNYTRLYKLISRKDIAFQSFKRGDKIGSFKGVTMEVINPEKLSGNTNDDSMVIKLAYKDTSFLFAADIGNKVCDELAILYESGGLKSDVLKVPHHGKDSTSGFISAVSPEVAVISVGPSQWGGPYDHIIALYKEQGIKVLRTDELGTIVIKPAHLVGGLKF